MVSVVLGVLDMVLPFLQVEKREGLIYGPNVRVSVRQRTARHEWATEPLPRRCAKSCSSADRL